jgi:signal transduction histidine kinase
MEPQTEQTLHIGRCILEHREAIIADWEARARLEHPHAGGAERRALRNRLPQFLEELGGAMARSDGPFAPTMAPTMASPDPPSTLAADHGVQRWVLGWDVAALTSDFMILRTVLLERLFDVVDVSARDVAALAAVFDRAVAQSVQAYADHRELQLKRQNEALRRKNYELKRFAHMVAHEVRSPLGLVTLAANALKRRLASLPPEARAQLDGASEQFELIAEARRQIVEVVDNLMGYADDAGELMAREDRVDLERIFDEAVEHLKYFIQSSDAAVSRGPLPTVRGNPVALRAVFQNLLENALKYAGEGPPRVRVSAAQDDDGDGDGQRYWAIAFRDHGMGISREDQRHIFRFLSRVNVQEAIPGTGVGLALCRRVAEQHGGSMAVQSTPGQGSTFTLRLPVGEDEDESAREGEGAA